MKILQIITSLDPDGGGPAENVRQSSRALSDLGHQIELASLDAPDAPWLQALDYPVYALGPGKTSYAYAPKFVPWLQANVGHYDCAIVRGLWQYSGFGTWQVLRDRDIPYFVFPHGMLDPWFKRRYPLKHLKKWLYWPWGEYRVLRDARAVLFTCEQERQLARESFGLYHCNEVVVNYGTRTPPNEPERQKQAFFDRFPQLRDRRLLLFLSRIHPKKGCDLLIEAFATVASSDNRLHLVMAGPDKVDWQAQLEERARQLGIAARITWTGMLSDDAKWGAIRAAEAFVLPSHQENFGIAVVEAMACQVPVLISTQVNIWREIVADRAGLAAEDTLEGTLQLLQQWLALDESERRQMQTLAQQSFFKRFEISQAARDLVAAIEGTPDQCEAIADVR
ncbi:glycosyltransferase [Synechococcus sp. PCC 7336]|uniref:glycosyltransferase n=1 Tax=Synechococcus sp. PCC 7336 TaxID=195250 RepID=UPI00034DCF6A|nr:glycosyltransferase [Synechococcus sp. PCC 7336]